MFSTANEDSAAADAFRKKPLSSILTAIGRARVTRLGFVDNRRFADAF